MDSTTPYRKIQDKAVLPDQPEPLFWEVIRPPIYPRRFAKEGDPTTTSAPQVTRKITRPMKTLSNPNNIYLKEVWSFSVMEDYLPHRFANDLDDILTGTALLNLGGNTRPVRKGLIFDMLRDLDEISTATVQEYTGFSERHARKVASLMRIAVTALNRLVDA
jgi:hypothetical protein